MHLQVLSKDWKEWNRRGKKRGDDKVKEETCTVRSNRVLKQKRLPFNLVIDELGIEFAIGIKVTIQTCYK